MARSKAAKGAAAAAAAPSPPEDTIRELTAESAGDQLSFVEGQGGISIRLRGVVSTGCDALDAALGRGGIPLGRLTILNGADGSGKTTQALEIIAEVQRRGGFAVYGDAEHKLDIPYAERVGVNMDQLVITQPPHQEAMFGVMEKWIGNAAIWREKYGDVPVAIVLDSINALTPKAELEADWEGMTVGAQSRFYSAKLPRLIGMAQRSGVALVFIAQLRDKIGIIYGKKTEISGGRALKHHATVIINYRRMKTIKKPGSDAPSAILVKAEVEKNQIAMPFRTAEFLIRLGHGFDREAALIDAAVEAGVVKRSGAWFSHGGDRIGQGIDQAAGYLRKAPEVAAEIRAEVLALDPHELKKEGESDD